MTLSPAAIAARVLLGMSVLALAACAGTPKKTAAPAPVHMPPAAHPSAGRPAPKRSPYAPAQEDVSKRGHYTAGGLYAPHIADSTPTYVPDVDAIPEPDVVDEPRSRYGNRSPYQVLGKSYEVRESAEGLVEQGLASYYGSKFHGRKTSNLEVYDMYAFTAAHKSLPLPSFARVTNLDTGRSVVVRVNDRGPFHDGRVIDLSYAAAVKIGVYPAGTGRVEVRGLSPGEDARNTYDAVAARTPPAPPVVPRPVPAAPTPAPVRSPIDSLVEALPIGAANASERTPARAASGPSPSAANDQNSRFDMMSDGRQMTADEFDAWMKARQVRIATGKPAPVQPTAAQVAAAEKAASANERKLTRAERRARDRAAKEAEREAEVAAKAARNATAPATAARAPAPAPAAPQLTPASQSAAAPAAGPQVTLQVAAFGARANAERALTMLQGAGIGAARLQDGSANGKQVWRLRVGPVAQSSVAELSARVNGLGFAAPQIVRD